MTDLNYDPECWNKGKPEVCAEINFGLAPILEFYLEELCFSLSSGIFTLMRLPKLKYFSLSAN